MNGGGVSRSIKFGSIGYLNNDDGMRGRSVIMVIYPWITSCYRNLDKMKIISESGPGLSRAGSSLLD